MGKAAIAGAAQTPRETPLAALHRSRGAQLADFAGWLLPLRYESERAEHLAVRGRAGVFDLSHMGEIEVFGPDAPRCLDEALVGDLSSVGVGRARYTMCCAEDGGVLEDLVAYRLSPERYLLVVNAANTKAMASVLAERFAGRAGMQDESDRWGIVALQGPSAAGILAPLVGARLEGLGYYAITVARVAGVEVLLARTGYTGEDGFELFVKSEESVRLFEAVERAGEAHGLALAGLAARDSLRLEAGMALYGHELTAEVTPFEAGLGRVVALQKPSGFVGREALIARAASGPHASLVGLVLEGRRPARAGYEVLDPSASRVVGQITSGAVSPTLGSSIAMAFVEPAFCAPGGNLAVDIRGTLVEARVTSLPFYRRAR